MSSQEKGLYSGLHEEGADFEAAKRPLVIYKVGALGCAPLDFFEKLADEYEAGFVSSDEVRLALMKDKAKRTGSQQASKQIAMRQIRRKVAEQATDYLNDDKDVVLDMFFNGESSRRLPQGLAEAAGGLTVAVSIKTPANIAFNRVRGWTQDEAFIVPVQDWKISPIRAAAMMRKDVVAPAENEADYVFKLDGGTDTEGLLEQFDKQFIAHGLAEEG